MQKVIYVSVLMLLSSCSGTGVKRVVIDESKNEPNWVSEEKLSWEDDGRLFFKAHQTVRGDQRLNGCYAIASHDNREALIRQQVESMAGQTNEAQADIAENAELILGKVRSGEWSGKLYGFRDDGYYFQRAQIRDEMAKTVTERIDCYTLSSISQADFQRSRDEILHKVLHIDQKIKDAINQKEADFFKKDAKTAEPVPEPEVKQEPITKAEPVKPAAPAVELPKEMKAPVAETPKPVEAARAPASEPAIEPANEVAKAVEPVASENIKELATAVIQ